MNSSVFNSAEKALNVLNVLNAKDLESTDQMVSISFADGSVLHIEGTKDGVKFSLG